MYVKRGVMGILINRDVGRGRGEFRFEERKGCSTVCGEFDEDDISRRKE